MGEESNSSTASSAVPVAPVQASPTSWRTASDAVILHWLAAFNQNRREHIAATFEDGWRIIDWVEGCGPRIEAALTEHADLLEALKECADRFERCCVASGSAPKYAAQAVAKYRTLIDTPQAAAVAKPRTLRAQRAT